MAGEAPLTKRLTKEAAKALDVRALVEDMTDDPQAILDAIEGETNFNEAICAVYEVIAEYETLAAACDAHVQQVMQRQARFHAQADKLGNIILMAMEKAGAKTIRGPLATITRADVPRKPIIKDESLIPAKFWAKQDPKLDKRAVIAAVKNGEEVPGTDWDNGGIALKIRRG